MAKYKHVQDKLRKEIHEVSKKHGGEVTYDAIMEMSYLECIIYGITIFNYADMITYSLIYNIIKH